MIGCDTCRTKKVKCDEKRPNCARCARLRLTCNWLAERIPLHAKRRGVGSLKTRDETWTSKPILPALTDLNTGDGKDSHDLSMEFLLDPPPLGPEQGIDDWWENGDPDFQSNAWLPVHELSGLDDSNDVQPNMNFDHPEPIAGNNGAPLQATTSMFMGQPLSYYHISLPNSLTLSTNEHDALRHYQTTFSLYRTTKDPKWSTHKVLLSFGSQNAMVMHLLLAVSINDQSLRRREEHAAEVAQSHFRAGALMLTDLMANYTESDHVPLMAAYFFLYLYMSKRKSIAPQRLKQLSLTVLEFVKSHELDARCLGRSTSLPQSEASHLDAFKYRSVLARLIMWTFDEDVKCSFQGHGGDFARYLTAKGERTKEVYDASRNALITHWGADYPNSQMLDDDQNSTVLEFLWAMMAVWQDINDLTQHPDSITSGLDNRIEQSFALLQVVSAVRRSPRDSNIFCQKYASVFRLSSEITRPRPRVLVNADYDVVLFNALRVYYFRSTIYDLGMETPPEIQTSLKILLTIIQRTFASKGTEMHDRLQWPLFLAGIETSDPIYKEWIFSRITSSQVSAALRRTLDAQDLCGQRLKMPEIRDLLYDNEGLILEGDNGFLQSIEAF